MQPIIALVGRQNVGKSTLFNRFTRSRDALVANFPGLTRDRKYGKSALQGFDFIVIDTAGITENEVGVDAATAAQSLEAVEESDFILFLVDGREGINVQDEFLASRLRRQDKPVILVMNKSDGIDEVTAQSDFYSLGLGEPVTIAASHGRGINKLLDHVFFSDGVLHRKSVLQEEKKSDFISKQSAVTDFIPMEINASSDLVNPKIDEKYSDRIRLAVIGRPNVGKSTLINRMLGEERVVVYDQAGTTRDSVFIPYERNGQSYTLIDTAGVRRRGKVKETVEKFSVVKTLQAINEAHVVLLLVDAREGLTDQDLHLLSFAMESGRALVLAVNKWDGLSDSDRKDVVDELERRLGFLSYVKINFISALHGSGVGNLYEPVCEAFTAATMRWPTAKLTQILEDAIANHSTPMVNGRRIKLRYCHMGGLNPPRLVIHGNQTDEVPSSYVRYLENTYRRVLKLTGTPIKVEFKGSENPYQGRKNKLTERQLKKRQRMITHIKRAEKKKVGSRRK